jgi:hypothetical protein
LTAVQSNLPDCAKLHDEQMRQTTNTNINHKMKSLPLFLRDAQQSTKQQAIPQNKKLPSSQANEPTQSQYLHLLSQSQSQSQTCLSQPRSPYPTPSSQPSPRPQFVQLPVSNSLAFHTSSSQPNKGVTSNDDSSKKLARSLGELPTCNAFQSQDLSQQMLYQRTSSGLGARGLQLPESQKADSGTLELFRPSNSIKIVPSLSQNSSGSSHYLAFMNDKTKLFTQLNPSCSEKHKPGCKCLTCLDVAAGGDGNIWAVPESCSNPSIVAIGRDDQIRSSKSDIERIVGAAVSALEASLIRHIDGKFEMFTETVARLVHNAEQAQHHRIVAKEFLNVTSVAEESEFIPSVPGV